MVWVEKENGERTFRVEKEKDREDGWDFTELIVAIVFLFLVHVSLI